MSKLYYTMILLTALFTLTSKHQLSAQCVATAGEPFHFSAEEYNDSEEYTNLYILTDYVGTILQTSTNTEFTVAQKGLYHLFAVNYKTADNIYGVAIGNKYSDIISSCFELSDPLEILVCDASENNCDTYNGYFSFENTEGNPVLNTVFVLTNFAQEIIALSDFPEFGEVSVGNYLVFTINYVTVDNLNIGNHIIDITGDHLEINNPLMLTSCQPCSVILGDDIELCGSQTVVLSASSESSGEFTWNTGQTGNTILITPTESTYYTVTLTTPMGCQAVDSILVSVQQKPIVNAGPNKEICAGASVVLEVESIPDASYYWSTGETTRSITVSPTVTSTYSIQVDKGVCSVYDDIVVVVNDTPNALITGSAFVCKGNASVLEASGGDYYVWNTGETTASITIVPTQSAYYTVTVSNSNGCSKTSSIFVNTDKCGKIGNQVWEDANGNGLKEAEEPGIAGVEVTLYSGETQLASMMTDAQGQYMFDGLEPDTYKLKFVAPAGFIGTISLPGVDNNSEMNPTSGFTAPFELEDQEAKLNIYAGFFKPGIIGSYVWEDVNGDGIQDEGEVGIEDVMVLMEGTDGSGQQVNKSVATDDQGRYRFEDIYPGQYTISFVIPNHYKVSPRFSGVDVSKDNDADADGKTETIDVVSGFDVQNIDAGLYRYGVISGLVWVDKGYISDVFDEGDETINGIEIQLYSMDDSENAMETTLSKTMSGGSGRYEFEVDKAGYYFVKVLRPKDYKFVLPFAGNGSDDSKISDSIAGKTDSFYIGYAGLLDDIYAGLVYSPLVVTLQDFTGYWDVSRDLNALKWVTTSEINNDYFELERSFELEPFSKIAKVKGRGNSVERQEYKYNDGDIQRNGIYNYRLRQVDFDGQFTYSNIVKIPVYREINGFTTTLYPNPTTDRSVLEVHSNKGIRIKVEVYDGVGRICYPFVFDEVLDDDIVRIPLDKAYLPRGMYHIKVSSDDQVNTLKWLIVK
ncbi:MAG: T9SS type A sorting domain-containing protein [Chitinophagales bacterium]|nr:T9SS type A sorting domain-containing protein [Chitinophagales bacterium]